MALPRRRFNKRRAARKPRRAARKPALRSRARPTRRMPRRKMGVKRVTGLVSGIATNSSVMIPTNRKLLHAKVARQIAMVGSPNQYIINTPAQLNVLANVQGLQTYDHITNFLLNKIRALISTQNAIRYVVEEYQSVFTITNTANAPVELDIYDITCKREVLAAMNYNTSTDSYFIDGSPSSYWVQGSRVQQNLPAISPSAAAYVPGSSPFDAQLFKEYFVVKKRTFVTLPLGATHRHSVLQKPKCVVTDAMLQNTAFSGEPGLTSYTMFVARGYPGGNAVGEGVSAGPVITNAQLNVLQATRVKYTWAQDLAEKTTVLNQLVHDGAYQIMNVGSGQPENWAGA